MRVAPTIPELLPYQEPSKDGFVPGSISSLLRFPGAEGEAFGAEEGVPEPLLPGGGEKEVARSPGCPGEPAESLQHFP